MSTLCPVCGKDDAIQKLSAIVASGQASGTFSGPSVGATRVDGKWGTTGGYTTLSGSTVTELARKLASPPQPQPKGGCVVALGVLLGGLFVLNGLLVSGDTSVGLGPALALILVGVCVIALPIAYYKKEQVRVAAQEEPAWEESMRKWQRLYYCFRDDLVFDSQTGETCQPDSLTEFLHSAS